MPYFIIKKLKESLGFGDTKKLTTNRFNPRGHVVVRSGTVHNGIGEVIFEKDNKITLAGAGFLSSAMFDFTDPEITPNYNNALSLDNVINTSVPENVIKTCLFAVGTDGCGTENSQVFDEDYTHWIDEDHIVPFQYRPINKDLSDTQRKNLYFGRKSLASYSAYYFKAFDQQPVRTQQYTDGTPIDSTVYKTVSPLQVQTIVNMQMSVTPDDCRDYFIETTGINDARINAISLCAAWYKQIGDYQVYQDIRPMTRLNFPNECLIDLNKGITIYYSVYF